MPGPAFAVATQQLPLTLTQVPAELSDGRMAARSPKTWQDTCELLGSAAPRRDLLSLLQHLSRLLSIAPSLLRVHPEHPTRTQSAQAELFLSPPKGAQHHQEGEAAAEAGAGADRVGELCEPSGPGGPGILPEQQILRGLPRTEVGGWGEPDPLRSLAGKGEEPPTLPRPPRDLTSGKEATSWCWQPSCPRAGFDPLSSCPWPHTGRSQQGHSCGSCCKHSTLLFSPAGTALGARF